MKPRTIVTVAGGAGYAGKPHLALVVQAEAFLDLPPVTMCLLTTLDVGEPETRVELIMSDQNGLRE